MKMNLLDTLFVQNVIASISCKNVSLGLERN